jgi:dihydroxyacetone kinase-like protein
LACLELINISEEISSSQFLELFKHACKNIIGKSQYLSELDMIGDADFGVNISRGFEEIIQKLGTLQEPDVGTILKEAGDVFVFDIGATIGGLFGRSLQKAGKQMEGKKTLGSQDILTILTTMLNTIKEIGGAKVGDKTLVDALEPAVNAVNEAVTSGTKNVKKLLEIAATASEEGAKKTTDLVSRIGRSSYLGERSKGTIDPGAMFIHLFFDALKQKA